MRPSPDIVSPRRFAAAERLTAGFIGIAAGFVLVAVVLSFVSFIYTGPLLELLPLVTPLTLAATALMNLLGARLSSLPGSLTIPQDAPTAILATTLAAAMAVLEPSAQLGTALAMVVVSSLVTAVVMLVMGWRRAGGLLRFVPVPVMGGFLGGTGWLLVAGAFDMARGTQEWTAATVANVVATFLIGGMIVVAIRRGAGPVIFPIFVAGAVAVFYLTVAVTPLTLSQARLEGLLPAVGGSFVVPELSLGAISWDVVASALPKLMTIPLVATMALLMNVGGLELLARRDARLDRELITAGWGNVVGSTLAAPAGYPTLGVSSVGYRVGIQSRSVTLVAAGVLAVAAVVGPQLVSGFPVAVAAGMIAMVGIGFLTDWLVDARHRIPRPEYVLMVAIIVAVALFGFLAGVAFGMAAAVILFAVKYSRIDPIRNIFTGRERFSSLDRTDGERRFLDTHGGATWAFELQGFLFFGTAHKAVGVIEGAMKERDLGMVIVDMRRVEGFDSTAVYAFRRLAQTAADHSVEVVYSQCPEALEKSLRGEDEGGHVRFLPELDVALEWSENRLLESFDGQTDISRTIDVTMWSRLEPRMDRITLGTDEVLADIGQDGDCVFFVTEGRVAVELPGPGGRWQRVRSVGPGSMLGELALYTGDGRSARLRAEADTVVYRLSPAAIRQLEEDDPACAVGFHKAVARVIADRLKLANDSVQALIR